MTESQGQSLDSAGPGPKLSWSAAGFAALTLPRSGRPPASPLYCRLWRHGLDNALPLADDAANNPSDGAGQRAAMNKRDGPRR
jgi:hypothetical protein